jgi:O-antigen ligase
VQRPPLSRLCEIAILTLLAFTVLFRGGKSLESTWLLLGVGAVCALINVILKGGNNERSIGRELWPFVTLFIVWTGLSYLFSSTQNYGLDEVLRTAGLCFLLLWYLEAHAKDQERRFEEVFVKLLTLTAVLSCLIGIAVYIGQPVNRFVGTFFDWRFHTDYWPNACAQFLLLVWPPVLLYCGSIKKIPGKTITREKMMSLLLRHGAIGLVLGGLFLTYSRGALVAFVGQIGLLTFLILRQQKTVRNLTVPLRRISVALFIGLIVFVSVNEVRSAIHPVQSIAEKITFSAAEGHSSVSERLSFWKQSALLSIQRPVFGWGPYSFRFVQPRLQRSALATSDHPHNAFLKFAMERGIVASLLFLLIVVAVLANGISLATSGKRLNIQSDHARIGHALLVTSVAGVVAHNLIDYNLQFVGIAMPFWLIMSMILSHAKSKRAQAAHWGFFTENRRGIVTAVIAALLLLVAAREGYYLVLSSLGRHAEAGGHEELAITYYNQASPEWFSRDMHLSKALLHLQDATPDDANASLKRYFEQNEEDARAWRLLAELNILQRKFPEAIEAYERSLLLGGWNDLAISRGLLEVLLAETFTQPTSDSAADATRLPLHPKIADIAPEIEKRAFAFKNAIDRNLHFSALSPNPEEAIKIFIMLSVLYPDKGEEYRASREAIEKSAFIERSKIKSRKPGWLW